CASPMVYMNLADGTHAFRVQAVDIFSNTDANGAGYSFQVDTQAPIVTLAAANTQTPTRQTSMGFTFSASEGSAILECQLDGAAFSASASPFALATLSAG